MYWNHLIQQNMLMESMLNSNIRCIEMLCASWKLIRFLWLNSNIRCIEITLFAKSLCSCYSWIVTLDVLKYTLYCHYCPLFPLNSNIRCIEMIMRRALYLVHYRLNSNIRCIEIMAVRRLSVLLCCWIVTLDVLK